MKINKRKLAIISLAVMMMVTAVGYSAFSDDLKVIGNAKNAKFDVQFKETAVTGEYVSVLANPSSLLSVNPYNGGGGHQPPDPYDNNDTVTVTVSNLIPGKSATATGHIQNLGSVYAYLRGERTLVQTTDHYKFTLTLPEVIDFASNANSEEYTVLVEMFDRATETETDGIGLDAEKYRDTCSFNFSYEQER